MLFLNLHNCVNVRKKPLKSVGLVSYFYCSSCLPNIFYFNTSEVINYSIYPGALTAYR